MRARRLGSATVTALGSGDVSLATSAARGIPARELAHLLDEPEHEAAPALIAEPWLSAASVVYHLCDRRAEPVLTAAAARELCVLARRPLAGGALTGSLGPGVLLPPRDDRGSLGGPTLER